MERFESVSLRESILSSPNSPFVPLPFDIDDWNLNASNATIRTMSGLDRFIWEQERETKNPLIGAIFVTLVLGNEHGAKMFDVSDAEAISKKDYRILDKIVIAGLKQNELTTKDESEQSKK